MIVAELRVIPVGSGASMEKPLERVVAALRRTGVAFRIGALGTTLEAPDLQPILDAVRAAHDAAAETAPRVILELTVDHRLDKEEDIQSLSSVKVSAR